MVRCNAFIQLFCKSFFFLILIFFLTWEWIESKSFFFLEEESWTANLEMKVISARKIIWKRMVLSALDRHDYQLTGVVLRSIKGPK